MTTIDLGIPTHGLSGVPRLAEGDAPQNKKDFTSDQEVRWCPGCGDYAVLAAVQSFLPELRLRRERPDAFGVAGLYVPLTTTTEHAIGFIRAASVATIVTRAPHRLAREGGFGDARVVLPTGTWTDRLTGREITVPATGEVLVADVLTERPVALLVRS